MLHILAVIALLASHFSLSFSSWVAPIILLHGLWVLFRWRRLKTLRLIWRYDQWWVITLNAKGVDVASQHPVVGCSFWQPWMVVINTEDAMGRLHYIPVLPDACPKEFARLQLIMRFLIR